MRPSVQSPALPKTQTSNQASTSIQTASMSHLKDSLHRLMLCLEMWLKLKRKGPVHSALCRGQGPGQAPPRHQRPRCCLSVRTRRSPSHPSSLLPGDHDGLFCAAAPPCSFRVQIWASKHDCIWEKPVGWEGIVPCSLLCHQGQLYSHGNSRCFIPLQKRL